MKKKKNLKKRGRGRPKKNKNNDLIDDDEENYAESEYEESYHDSESEENKEAMKGLEAEELEDEKEEREMREDPDYIGINDDDDDENYSIHSRNKNKNKNKKNKNNNTYSIDGSSDMKNYEYKKDPNFLKYKHHKILMEKMVNDSEIHNCFFCHQNFLGDKESNIKIFGPFYFNENNGKILTSQTNMHMDLKEIYIDINCLAENNDFSQTNKRDCIFNPASSIEEVIRQNKICFRCGSTFATKKCHSCQKMFHGNLCLNQMTEEFEGHKYCLECLKKKYFNYLQEKIKHNNKRINYDLVSKNYFLSTKIYNSQYYPQLGEEVYFILHAYIQFLRDKYQYILYEVEENQRIFWWMDNIYTEKNPRFNFYEPFICKVSKIEYCFPNEKTIVLIKEKSLVNQFRNNVKILIKLQLQIVDLDNMKINIVLFENDNPDFLVRKNIYDETLKYYQDNIITKKIKNIQMNLSEDVIDVILVDNKAEESNADFATSKFNSLKVVTEQDKDEQKYSFWDICINNNLNNTISKKMKFIMNGLYDTLNSVCEKNEEINIFYDMVSEDKAPNYYEEIPVPMHISLINDRLINHYYITEESIKFDIQLLVDNATKYNGANSGIAKDAEILKKRLMDEINKLANKYEENNNINNDVIFNSNNGNGNDSTKKFGGKKRKRILTNLDLDEEMLGELDESEDYLYGNQKKRELRSNNRMNTNNNITGNNNKVSINIPSNINKNSPSIKKKNKKKKKV